MAGVVFHVEFGFNDTALTRALESGNYTAAERIIRETNNPSSLNEGCYQRTPLFICLCGLDSEEKRVKPRNLFLAKLLVERGANVNYRVPTTFFGCEYMGPGKTALELLVDFYIDLTRYGNTQGNEAWSAYHSSWDPTTDPVIGLTKQYLTSLEDVIEHVEDLVFIILGIGGDATIQDEKRQTPLHKLAVSSYDIRLFKLLCENGACVNTLDVKGNSPLLALCDLSASEMYDYLEDLSPSSSDTLEDTSANLRVKKEFLNYILLQKDLQINISNLLGQTALFHCVIRGDVEAAYKLLRKGADSSIRGTVWETRKRKRKISPIFTTFLSIPLQRSLCWESMHHKIVTAPRQYAHLVDAGYFSRREIVMEMCELLDSDFPEFSHLQSICNQLVSMMFGQTSASLTQLATRSVFHHCFIKNRMCVFKLLPSDSLKQKLVDDNLHDAYEEYISFILNRTVLQALVAKLSLPKSSVVNFEVELLLHRLANKLSSLKAMPPENIFCDSDGSIDLTDSDTTQSEGGDSDLEYW